MYLTLLERYIILWHPPYSWLLFITSRVHLRRLGGECWWSKIYWWYIVFLGTTLVSWKSVKQRTIARSSTKAKYKALAYGTAEVLWLRYLLTDLWFSLSYVTTIWYDNLGATFLSSNLIFHARTKHVEVDYHFVRDRVAKREIQIRFISFTDQLENILTKSLSYSTFALLRPKLYVDNQPSAWGGVLWNVLE
jgi:histone deacetylase 1/2